mgnify:CR=1 FL=1
MSLDDIKIEDNTCIIYASRKRRIREVKDNVFAVVIIPICFLSLPNFNLSRLSGLSIVILIFGSIGLLTMLYLSIRRLKKAPNPIVLTKKGLTLPSGVFIEWERIEYIRFDYLPYAAIPPLQIKVFNGVHEDFQDWPLYTNKKTLVFLFEKFAGKKLLRKN